MFLNLNVVLLWYYVKVLCFVWDGDMFKGRGVRRVLELMCIFNVGLGYGIGNYGMKFE